MAISTNFPADNLVPGVGGEFDLITGSRTLPAVERKVLLIGSQRPSGVTAVAEKVYQVFDENDADTLWGIGSEVALEVRAALATARALGVAQPEIWGCGIAEPGGGVAATGTFTVVGTATANGEAILRIAGRPIRVNIKLGDVQNTIATTVRDAINQVERTLPVGATAATNVVTCTYRTRGTNGNDVKIEVDQSVAGVTITASAAALAGGTGLVDITNALTAAETADYWVIAISNNESADVTDWNTHADLMWATMSDRYRFLFLADIATSSAATTLAGTTNSERVCIESAASARSLPCEIAATIATMTQAREKPNYNHNLTAFAHLYGPNLDLGYDEVEQQAILKAGVTPLVPFKTGDIGVGNSIAITGLRLVRLVTTKTTHNSVPFNGLIDFAKPYTVARLARLVDDEMTLTLDGRNVDNNTLADAKSVALNIARDREAEGWLKDVEALKEEFRVEVHPTNRQRILLDVPWRVVDIAAQVIVKNRLLSA